MTSMRTHIALFGIVAAGCIAVSQLAFSQDSGNKPATQQQEMPLWMSRGLPDPGHRALDPLIGTWKVRMSIRGHDARNRGWRNLLAPGLARLQQHGPPL
jgi:hypothetical protein